MGVRVADAAGTVGGSGGRASMRLDTRSAEAERERIQGCTFYPKVWYFKRYKASGVREMKEMTAALAAKHEFVLPDECTQWLMRTWLADLPQLPNLQQLPSAGTGSGFSVDGGSAASGCANDLRRAAEAAGSHRPQQVWIQCPSSDQSRCRMGAPCP